MSLLDDPVATVAALPAFLVPLVVFVSSMLEYVFPPYWGDTLILVGFFLAGQGVVSWFEIFAAAVSGALLGALIAYWLGKRYGLRTLRRFSRIRRRDRPRQRVQVLFRRYGEPVLVINRFLPVVRGIMLYAAGAMELRLRPVLIYSTIGSVAWVALIMGLGWLTGGTWEQLQATFEQSSRIFGIIAFILLGGWLIALGWRFVRGKNGADLAPAGVGEAGSAAHAIDHGHRPATRRAIKNLVLIGGGHTHVQVLKRFAMEPPVDTRITVILDRPIAVYSGMVPGFVAGQYSASELEIDVVPLARRARARVILAAAERVDAEARQVHVVGRPPVDYDVCSVDIGSSVAGLDLPGIAERALPTRPISGFVERADAYLQRAREEAVGRSLRVVVVGAGAGGVEVAFALARRLAREGVAVDTTLVQSGPRILPGYSGRLARRVEALAHEAGITIRCGTAVQAAEVDDVVLEDGDRLPYDLLAWVTGAVAHPLGRSSSLATDDRGFIWTRDTLEVEGHDGLFAVGDCATMRSHSDIAKAGVYAVRQGPFLIDNLRAALGGERRRRYRPQRDFLTLLNLADGRALGAKWGWVLEGRWVMRLKDWIDRRFMRKFQVLADDGALSRDFARDKMEMGEMLCGGCAAKLGQSALERALARIERVAPDPTVVLGLETPDDASAIRTPGGDVVVSSLDAFRAFTDDPYQVGKVGAANAASDLLAKGVRPRYALALVALPQGATDAANESMLVEILAGARETLDALGITLLGGHTMTSPELIVGFNIEGLAAGTGARATLLPIDGLEVGQKLVLTKALGTGVLFHADMQGRARGPWVEAALASMARTNAAAARVALDCGATAATDITGFGVVGHLAEMVRSSGVSGVVDVANVVALPGAVELLSLGLRSTFHPENARMKRGILIRQQAERHPHLDLLFDPQTSGGLLFGVAAERAEEAIERLVAAGDGAAAVIGEVVAQRDDGAPIELIASATD